MMTVITLLLCFSGKVFSQKDSNVTGGKIPDADGYIEDISPFEIDKIITVLSNETLEKSMERLNQFGLYIPGENSIIAQELDSRIPISPSNDRRDLLAIMSNRRVLKVIKELSLLSKETAGELVKKEIITSLKDYNNLYDSTLQKNSQRIENNKIVESEGIGKYKHIGFPTYVTGKNPTLRALRYKILSLVYIAGNLELKECKDVVEKVMNRALEQREFCYDSTLNRRDSFWILYQASLYNRRVLASGLLGITAEAKEAEKILEEINKEMVYEELTTYDSPVAVYDSHTVRSFRETDYSKGRIQVKYINGLNDSEFEKIINKLKEIKQAEAAETANPNDPNN